MSGVSLVPERIANPERPLIPPPEPDCCDLIVSAIQSAVYEIFRFFAQLFTCECAAIGWAVRNQDHIEGLQAYSFILPWRSLPPLTPTTLQENDAIGQAVDAFAADNGLKDRAAACDELNRRMGEGYCHGQASVLRDLIQQNPQATPRQLLSSLERAGDRVVIYQAIEEMRGDAQHRTEARHLTQAESQLVWDFLRTGGDGVYLLMGWNDTQAHTLLVRTCHGQYFFHDSLRGRLYSYATHEALILNLQRYVEACYASNTFWYSEKFPSNL